MNSDLAYNQSIHITTTLFTEITLSLRRFKEPE